MDHDSWALCTQAVEAIPSLVLFIATRPMNPLYLGTLSYLMT